jgi:AraC-like DNA-binding protein
MKHTRVVRCATLIGFKDAADQVGLDEIALLREANIPTDYMDHLDRFISIDSFVTLLELSAKRSGHTDFGFRASLARGIPDLGPVTLLLREEETLGDALKTFSSRLHLHSDSMIVELTTRFSKPFLSFRMLSNVPGIQVSQFAMCGLIHNIRWLVGPDWRPEAVCYAHARPANNSLQQSFFKAELRYDQVVTGLLLGKESLKLKVATSYPVMRRHAKNIIERSLWSGREDFAQQVIRLITLHLPEGRCSADSIAATLGIDRRTLSRRLDLEGVSYSSLLQRVRSELATSYVRNDSLTLAEATEATGFQSPSAFTRWFHTAFGCTPSDWRRQHLARQQDEFGGV